MIKIVIILFLFMCVASSQISDLIGDIQDQNHEDIIEQDGHDAEEVMAPVVVKSLHLSESYYRLYLVYCILATAVIFMWIILRFISKSPTHTSDDIVTGAGLVVVVMGTLFIVIASTTTEALTAAIGLLGAVGGYVFGKGGKDKSNDATIQALEDKVKLLEPD